MSKLSGVDPIDRLRVANPLPAANVPDASLARVSARVQEHTMTDDEKTFTQPRARWRPLAVLAGAALTGALVVALGSSALGGQLPGTGDGDGKVPPGGGMAMCIQYDPALLPTFDVVFDGTVTAVDGRRVTFQVNQGWKGASGSLTLDAPDSSVSLVGPMPDFEVGGRYLVTAAAGSVNGCGYTLDYGASDAAAWAAAF